MAEVFTTVCRGLRLMTMDVNTQIHVSCGKSVRSSKNNLISVRNYILS